MIPGWGISGITGLFLTIASVFMASQDFVLPEFWSPMESVFDHDVNFVVQWCALFTIAATFIVKNIGYIPIFSKLVLAPPDSEEEEVNQFRQTQTNRSSDGFGWRLGEVGFVAQTCR